MTFKEAVEVMYETIRQGREAARRGDAAGALQALTTLEFGLQAIEKFVAARVGEGALTAAERIFRAIIQRTGGG